SLSILTEPQFGLHVLPERENGRQSMFDHAFGDLFAPCDDHPTEAPIMPREPSAAAEADCGCREGPKQSPARAGLRLRGKVGGSFRLTGRLSPTTRIRGSPVRSRTRRSSWVHSRNSNPASTSIGTYRTHSARFGPT